MPNDKSGSAYARNSVEDAFGSRYCLIPSAQHVDVLLHRFARDLTIVEDFVYLEDAPRNEDDNRKDAA